MSKDVQTLLYLALQSGVFVSVGSGNLFLLARVLFGGALAPFLVASAVGMHDL